MQEHVAVRKARPASIKVCIQQARGTGNHPSKASGASLADGVRGGDGRPQAAVGRERVAAAARHLAQRQPRRLRPVRPLQQALNAHKRAPNGQNSARIMANAYLDLEQRNIF